MRLLFAGAQRPAAAERERRVVRLHESVPDPADARRGWHAVLRLLPGPASAQAGRVVSMDQERIDANERRWARIDRMWTWILWMQVINLVLWVVVLIGLLVR